MTDVLECGHEASPHESFTTGYGTDAAGKRHCYDCCARIDRQTMLDAQPGDRFMAYCREGRLVNWPGHELGKVSFGARHPWSRDRYYVRAWGPDGRAWHGTGAEGMWASLRKCRD